MPILGFSWGREGLETIGIGVGVVPGSELVREAIGPERQMNTVMNGLLRSPEGRTLIETASGFNVKHLPFRRDSHQPHA